MLQILDLVGRFILLLISSRILFLFCLISQKFTRSISKLNRPQDYSGREGPLWKCLCRARNVSAKLLMVGNGSPNSLQQL